MTIQHAEYDRLVENLVDALYTSNPIRKYFKVRKYCKDLMEVFEKNGLDEFIYSLNSLVKPLKERNLIGSDIAIKAIMKLCNCYGQSQRQVI